MNFKKLAIIGVIALVVFGCVLAAGCTSSTTQQTQTSDNTSNNQWIGMWGSQYKYGDGTSGYATILIKEDGTAIWTGYEVDTNDRTIKVYEETWKKTGENKISLTNLSTGKSYNYEYDAAKGTLTETTEGIVNVYNRIEPILGTWGTLCKDFYIGNEITTFLEDGTGKDLMLYITKETDERTFTWTKIGLNTYKLTYNNGDVWQVKIIDDEKELEWKLITLKDQILGTRTSNYEQDGKKIIDQTTFKDDFTGISVGNYADVADNEKITTKFTWKKIGPNTYLLSYENGNNWIGVYDIKDNTVNYKLIDLSDEPIIGTHKQDGTEYGVEGTIDTTFYANGTGKEVHTTKGGISETYDLIWNKTDIKNIYKIVYFGKNLREFWIESYNTQTKSLESELNYYILDENYRYNDRHHLDIHITNDKTGVASEYDGNDNMKEYKTTWEEIKTNIFKVTYDDGEVWYATYSPTTDTYKWDFSL